MLSYSNKLSKFMNIILFLKDNIYIETFINYIDGNTSK